MAFSSQIPLPCSQQQRLFLWKSICAYVTMRMCSFSKKRKKLTGEISFYKDRHSAFSPKKKKKKHGKMPRWVWWFEWVRPRRLTGLRLVPNCWRCLERIWGVALLEDESHWVWPSLSLCLQIRVWRSQLLLGTMPVCFPSRWSRANSLTLYSSPQLNDFSCDRHLGRGGSSQQWDSG